MASQQNSHYNNNKPIVIKIKMQSETISVINQIINDVWHNFLSELKIRQLSKLIPEYNKGYVSKMAGAGTGTAYMQHTPLRKIMAFNQLNEDQFPPNLPIDQFANFVVKSIKEDNLGLVLRQKSPQKNSKQSHRYKRTGASFRATATSKMNKQDSQQLSKYFVIPPPNDKQPEQLPTQKVSQEEIDLQYQLRAIQKKLYFSRQSKKQEEQKQKQRLLALKRRKSPQMPRTDFTYQFNGNFMRRKVVKNDSLLADEMKVSQSFDLHAKNKKNLHELLEQADPNRGRSQIGSRYQKANIFNNANKRQVSHLPFMRMTDNSRLKEENKNTQGNKTERLSLKSFSQSLQQKGFKHHSQLQKQKKDKQLLAKLQAQRVANLQQQLNKNPQQPQDDGYNNLIRRRQSYLMNKYMKKLKQQQGEDTKKSLNFNRVSFPRNSAIHNYYKHDFNEQRKFYESQVISRVLDNVGNPGNTASQR